MAEIDGQDFGEMIQRMEKQSAIKKAEEARWKSLRESTRSTPSKRYHEHSFIEQTFILMLKGELLQAFVMLEKKDDKVNE
eukprot:scaffold11073_cov70-Skeletonema_dohrnii-CCMP3373.AAC.2